MVHYGPTLRQSLVVLGSPEHVDIGAIELMLAARSFAVSMSLEQSPEQLIILAFLHIRLLGAGPLHERDQDEIAPFAVRARSGTCAPRLGGAASAPAAGRG